MPDQRQVLDIRFRASGPKPLVLLLIHWQMCGSQEGEQWGNGGRDVGAEQFGVCGPGLSHHCMFVGSVSSRG